MELTTAPLTPEITRRSLLKTLLYGGAGLALYSGEIERHWIDVVHRQIRIAGLPEAFDGWRIAQLSDIHLDEFTEPFLLREAIQHINHLQPDMVLLTGDFVSAEVLSKKTTIGAAWECASILTEIACPRRYAILGNHDVMAGADEVADALNTHDIPVLRNAFVPIERGNGRMWLAGVEDPLLGRPNPDRAIPAAIRNQAHEPVVLMCHAPDFADALVAHPVGRSIDLMLSGHTHGGQVRLPFVGALRLPPMGRKYVEGWFPLGAMQLYVNRGIGSVGVPFRFDCRPEITCFTLRVDKGEAPVLKA
jgi:predicted MPP superfamily phosphohydrolase